MARSWGFEAGRSYHRRRDIHGRFGGQRQGGISTPKDHSVIFAFTGGSGRRYGYEDYWTPDGVFCLYGEGQRGDMQFRAGNKAIRDHITDGRDLLLFEMVRKGQVRYGGQFVCESWHQTRAPDTEGRQRDAIVFHLVPVSEEPTLEPELHLQSAANLAELRRRAMAASQSAPSRRDSEAKRSYIERSAVVRAYVLARASGECEGCGRPAPFAKPDGQPFLEVHHIRRLTDEGPDDPRFCIGICPNCHREAHYGEGADELNVRLKAFVEKKEKTAEKSG